MPIPLMAIASALAAGGTLVPHATGGLIVTGAGGYIAGTFISTAAVTGLLATASATLGASALYVSGAAATIWGGAGIFGTTLGATGVKGALMWAGLIASTPIWILVAAGAAVGGFGYAVYHLFSLRQKLQSTPDGAEAVFTEADARIIESIIKKLAKKRDD
jgi:hypothetical protein